MSSNFLNKETRKDFSDTSILPAFVINALLFAIETERFEIDSEISHSLRFISRFFPESRQEKY